MSRSFRSWSAGLCWMILAGCSGGGGADDLPALAPVKGKVFYNGQPLSNAQVQFAPETGGPSSGETNASGEFTLVYRNGQPGAAIGKHQVTVTAGGATPEQQAALDASANGDRSVTVPTNIAPVVTYTATAIVAEGDNDLSIDVMKAAGASGGPRNSAER